MWEEFRYEIFIEDSKSERVGARCFVYMIPTGYRKGENEVVYSMWFDCLWKMSVYMLHKFSGKCS